MRHILPYIILLSTALCQLITPSPLSAQIPTENLKLWLKADNVIIADGFVSQWTDVSGNDLHFTQPNVAKRPSQTSNIYAGHQAIHFDGIDDNLKSVFLETMNQPATVFVVWKKDIAKAQNIFDGIDASNRMSFNYPYSVLENLAIFAGGVGVGPYYTKPLTSNLTVNSLIFNTTSKVFDNGILKISGNAGTMGVNGITIGSDYNLTKCFNGDIAEIIVYSTELTDAQRQQVEQYFMDKYAPPVSLGSDITVDYGFCPQTLSIANGYTNILWSNGAATQTIEISESGKYWVRATDIFGRISSDTINVTYTVGTPQVFSQNTLLCPDSSYRFHTDQFNSLNQYSVKWFNGFEGDTLELSNYEGNIWATITDNAMYSKHTDTIIVDIDLFDQNFTLGDDISFCSGNVITLLDNPLINQITGCLWSNGSTDNSIVITASGEYWVEVGNNNGCLSRDTVYVTVEGIAPTVDFDISGACINTPVTFLNNSTADLSDPITSVLWNFGDENNSLLYSPQHIYTNSGVYNVRLDVYAQSGCNNHLIKPLTTYKLPKAYFQTDTACMGNQYFFFDGTIPQPETTIEAWHWDFGNSQTSDEINPTVVFSQIMQHNVSLTVTDNNGCQGVYDTTITVVESMPNPEYFTLIWPPNNYVSNQNTFLFSWNNSHKAHFYSFEISSDNTFQTTQFQTILTNKKIEYTLPDGNYYWRVQAYNYCGDVISSNTHFLKSGFISSQNNLMAAFSASKQVEANSQNFVDSWGDLTGLGFTASQTNEAKKPKLKADVLNGKPALHFAHNNSANYLDFNNIDLSNHEYTIFAVIKPESYNLPVHYFMSGGYGTPTEGGLFAGGQLIKGIGSFDGTNTLRSNTNNSQWQIAVFQNDKILINGTEVQYGSYANMSGLQLNTVGTRSSTTETQYFNGYVSDLLIFNTKLTSNEIESVQDYIRYQYFPPVNLGNDTALVCGSCNYTLSVLNFYSTYLWSNGATTSTIDVNHTGKYWVKVTDIFGFTSTDTVFVKCPTQSCYPLVNLGNDIDIECGLCETEISAFAPHFVSYIWSNGETTNTITATETGYYYVTATDIDGYTSVDSVFIQCPSVSCDPPVDLGSDVNIEYGFCPVTLNAGDIYVNYHWSTGETTQTITVSQAGYYYVTVTDQYNYQSTDSIKITYPLVMLSDTSICAGESIILNTGLGNEYQYFWSNTSMSETITVSQQQDVWVLVTDNYGCQYLSPTVTIKIDSTSLFPVFTDNSVSICSGNSIHANLSNTSNYSYLWSTGAETNFIDVYDSGRYYITVTSLNLCTTTDSIDVDIIGTAPIIDIEAENLCLGATLQITDNSYSADNSNITIRNWRLSDGQTFTGNIPHFTATTVGINTLILELETENGCQNTDSIDFEVYPLPDFQIRIPEIICERNIAQFEAITNQTNITLWSWDFGDSNGDIIQNPQHTYSTAGIYQIMVTAISEFGCSYTKTVDIVVHQSGSPQAQIELLLPADQETINSQMVIFNWVSTNSDIFELYKIEVSRNSNFSTILNSATTTTNTYTATLSTTGLHYWRIKGYTLCNDSAVSVVQSFTIFTPASIANIQLWLNADNVVLENELVAQWTDVSGNNLHFVQPNIAKRPSQTSNIYAGHKAIHFDGIDDNLKSVFLETMHQPTTVFVVWKKDISKAQNIFDGIDASNRMTFNYPYSNLENLAIFAGTTVGIGPYYAKPVTSNLTVSSLIFNTTSKIFDNGILKISGNAGTMGINGITIGSDYNLTKCFNGDIAEFIVYKSELTDTQHQEIEQYLMDKYAPPVSLGPDITVEYGFCPVALQIDSEYTDIEWSTGETTPQIYVTKTGKYWVSAIDIFGRTTSDTINVALFDPTLPSDIQFCFGSEETVELNLDANYSFVWSTGETSNSISVTEPGSYWVKITDSFGCFVQKDFNVYVDMFEINATLGDNKALCNGNRIFLESGANEAVDYLWSDGSTLPWFTLNNQTEVSVTVTNINGCIAYDTVQINIIGNAPDISFDNTPLCKGNNFVFTNLSQTTDGSNINLCRWIFNQKDTIFGNEATYNYSEYGNLPVELYVETTVGCYQDTSFNATVYQIPNVGFVPASACERNNVLFQSTSTVADGEIIQWNWDINGTQYHSSGFKHTFANSGMFPVKLIVTSDKGCTDSLISEFNVKNSPVADFSFGKGCEGEKVIFINQSTGWLGSSLDYLWLLDSQTQSIQVNPEHLFLGTGDFPVKLVVTQQVNHCRDTVVKTVSVSEKPISVPNDIEVCAKKTAILTDNSQAGNGETIISKIWRVSQPIGNIEESTLYTFDTSGVFGLVLTLENSAGCKDVGQSQLTIFETPKAIIFTPLDTVYVPTTTTLLPKDTSTAYAYRWYLDNQFIGSNTFVTHQINNEGTYNFGLAIKTKKGCSDSTNKVLTALIPKVDLEVKSLSAVVSDGKILIRPVFRNNGTIPLSQFIINVRMDNGTTFSEIFESTLYSGNEQGYTLRTRVSAPENGTPIYVCLDVVTVLLDQNPDNNYKCFLFEDNTRIFPPSPNPVRNEIKFTIISDIESNCEISIVNAGGVLLWKGNPNVVSGLNNMTISTPTGAEGIIYMRIKVNTKQQLFKIMIDR